MPKKTETKPENCPCCQHPLRGTLDTQISSGVPYRDIARNFPGLTVRAVENHGRCHTVMQRADIVKRVEAIEEGSLDMATRLLVPDTVPQGKLWDWSRDLLIEATLGLRDLSLETRSIRAYDVLLRALELSFKVADRETSEEDGELEFRLVLAVPDEVLEEIQK